MNFLLPIVQKVAQRFSSINSQLDLGLVSGDTANVRFHHQNIGSTIKVFPRKRSRLIGTKPWMYTVLPDCTVDLDD